MTKRQLIDTIEALDVPDESLIRVLATGSKMFVIVGCASRRWPDGKGAINIHCAVADGESYDGQKRVHGN